MPYYIDGGAGGELYTTGPVGTDHGYWHGFRLIRVDGDRIVTDTVPIFVKDGIRIEGPTASQAATTSQFAAFGKQPVFNDPAKVEALELRDPDPQAKSSALGGSLWLHGRWLVPPLAIFLVLGIATGVTLRRRVRFVALPACLVALTGVSAVAIAQQSEPTSTPKDDLPIPARIWTSDNPNVLRPIASAGRRPAPRPGDPDGLGCLRSRVPGADEGDGHLGLGSAAQALHLAERLGQDRAPHQGRAEDAHQARPAGGGRGPHQAARPDDRHPRRRVRDAEAQGALERP